MTRILLTALLLAMLSSTAIAGGSSSESADYERDIKPILAHKCGACHGALRQRAGLRLDAGVLIHKGGKNGAVVVPGDASESRIIKKVSASDPKRRMPPAGEGEPLSDEEISLLRDWIDSGAVVPKQEPIPLDPRLHWAFQAPNRAPPPSEDRSLSHPVDQFIAAAQRRSGLSAAPRADRFTRLRRVYLDLIGIPPTRRQIAEFVQDESPRAWARVVDDLLASPHLGQRWGRHWMDVWRYSDWDGYKQQLRGSQRHIWRWREWIIQSLNSDKGYDRMVVEMIAGDELAPTDSSVLPATGFLARNYHKSNRNIWLDATVEHTAKAFLGLTLNCARCHDHKFDPIPQLDYYRFRAIFEPHKVRTDQLPGQADLMKDGLPRAYDDDLSAQTFLYLGGNEKRPDKDHPLAPGVPDVLGGVLDVRAIELPVFAYYPSMNQHVVDGKIAAAQRQLTDAQRHLNAAEPAPESASRRPQLELSLTVARLRLDSLNARLAADRAHHHPDGSRAAERPPRELAVEAARLERELNARRAELDLLKKRAELHIRQAAEDDDAGKKQAAVDKAQKAVADAEKSFKKASDALRQTDDTYTPLGERYPQTSSGRRLALARWIVSKNNPLTARVAVNHIWMRHFGAPLVENVFDFGLRSGEPVHRRLLDWLAVELMEHDWSMKHLHRLIVTSRTWQAASSMADPEAARNMAIDPDNRLLWRGNVRRLDAEIVRDNVLAVAGNLDGSFGGPDIDFHHGELTRRRSVYIRHAYEKQMPMLVLFDAASPTECYRRSESIVPQQALALANSTLSLSNSRLLASQLRREFSDTADGFQSRFVKAAFAQILSRPPDERELAACLEFLSEQAKTLSDPSKLTGFVGGSAPRIKPALDPHHRALENLVHVLMNHNDFVTLR